MKPLSIYKIRFVFSWSQDSNKCAINTAQCVRESCVKKIIIGEVYDILKAQIPWGGEGVDGRLLYILVVVGDNEIT